MASSTIPRNPTGVSFVNRSTGSYNLDDYSGFDTIFVERSVDSRINAGTALPDAAIRVAFGIGQIQFGARTDKLYFRIKWGTSWSSWVALN